MPQFKQTSNLSASDTRAIQLPVSRFGLPVISATSLALTLRVRSVKTTHDINARCPQMKVGWIQIEPGEHEGLITVHIQRQMF